jgi:adenylate kinase family enzyme
MQLNNLQTEAKNLVKDSLSKKIKVLIITGEAGSGKTTLIADLYKDHPPFDKVFVATLSGRAADVLRKKGVKKARTIQSLIFGKPKFEWWQRVLIKNSKIKKSFQERGAKNLFIYDEASMIVDWMDPNSGWNKKEHDLDAIISFANLNPGEENLLMFVGDENQLGPPISGRPYEYNFSSCLSPDFWIKKGYKESEIRYLRLGESHRQSKDSEILNLSRRMVKTSNLAAPFYDSKSIYKIDHHEIINQFIQDFKKNKYSTKILGFTNQLVYEYNVLIRNKLYGENAAHKLLKNDILLVVKNNYFYPDTDFLNGEYIEIVGEPKIEKGNVITLEVPKVDLNGRATKKLEKIDFSVDYATVKIKTESKDSLFKTPVVEIKVIVDTLDIPMHPTSSERRVFENKIQAWLREDFFVRNPDMVKKLRNAKNKDEKYQREQELQEEYEKDPYFNALWVNWGYAVTTHKAQGGEWKNIIADFSFHRAHNFNWAYTSVTRAISKLYLYDYPIEGLDEKPEYEGFSDKSLFFGKTFNKLFGNKESNKTNENNDLQKKIDILEKEISELKKNL